MKRLLNIVLVFAILVMTGCALSGFLSSPKEVEMFVMDPDSGAAVQLPPELSKDKFADEIFLHRCWNSSLCVMIYRYDENDDPGFEYVNFWYT